MRGFAKRIIPCLMAALFFLPAAAPRAETPVDLELVLAVDASGSVDDREFALQLDGIANAFRDEAVQRAIAAGELGRIAVALMIWSDAATKKAASRWIIVDGPEAAEEFAALTQAQLVRRKSFLGKSGTGIGAAIGKGIQMIKRNGIDGTRRVIDVSGDGHETPLAFGQGMALPEALRRARRRDVTVNGLAILSDHALLTTYYQRRVISGPGAFVVVADDYDDFARAIRIKLLREIQVLTGQLDPSRKARL